MSLTHTHVFVSYLREDREAIDRLCYDLKQNKIEVWLDREKILPGERWQIAIRRAIENGAFFVACFSSAHANRDASYMNVELAIAIEQLALRPADRAWFIPVILDGGRVPDRPIGGGETLRDIQWVDLSLNWQEGVQRILTVLRPAKFAGSPVSKPANSVVLMVDVVGSSQMAIRLEASSFQNVFIELNKYLSKFVTENAGQLVMNSGDGMIAKFEFGPAALKCAHEIISFIGSHGILGEEIQLRVGIAEGQVSNIGSDIVGHALLVAARICSAAGPNEILCTESLGMIAANLGWGYRDRGQVNLKGLSTPMRLFEIVT